MLMKLNYGRIPWRMDRRDFDRTNVVPIACIFCPCTGQFMSITGDIRRGDLLRYECYR